MKQILFLCACLFILAMGINDAAAQSLVGVSPAERSGVLNGIYSATVITLDANGRPAQGNAISFSCNIGGKMDSAEDGSFSSATVNITTDASGEATAYIKLTQDNDLC